MKIFKLDSQKLKTIQTCLTKTNYKHELGLIPTNAVESTNSALDMGTVMHTCLDSHYKLIRLNYDGSTISQVQIVEESEMRGRAKAAELNLTELEVETVTNSYIQYAAHYARIGDYLPIENGVEQYFAFTLYENSDDPLFDGGLKIIVDGVTDLIINKDGTKIPVDHKTTSRKLVINTMDDQPIIYAIAFDSKWFVYNEIGLQKTVKPEDKFKRWPISIHDTAKSSWKIDTINVVRNYIFHLEAGYFPKTRTSCVGSWGRHCPYYDICSDQNPEDVINTMYHSGHVWDPMRKAMEE